MKKDYSKTIEVLKEKEHIKTGDKFAFCNYVPKTEYLGTITRTTYSKVDYIIIANDEEIKILDIDKKTGEFLGTGVKFPKEKADFIHASKGLFGGRYIAVRADYADKYREDYSIPKKFRGYAQLEARLELYDYIKEVYNTYYQQRKLQRKEEKAKAKEQKRLEKEEKKNKPF